MIRNILLAILLCLMALCASAQDVTVHAVDAPAADVFRTIMEQTGKNFVYATDVLRDVRVTVEADNKPLKMVLDDMFRGSGIDYRIRGNDVVLKRRPTRRKGASHVAAMPAAAATYAPTELDELVVVSRLEAPAVVTAEIGAKKLTADDVRRNPALFGESDVIKALHRQPGVAEGTEGLAGMNVHGGNADQNLYLLDNVPLYQVNHLFGLFSAFNTDIIRNIDFFKSSIPAKYDGRLSSFMDVRLQGGSPEGHHGSARLGLTSGSFNLSGPVGKKTTYLVGVRRSWLDVLTIPIIALANVDTENKTKFHYFFMDFNAKVTHRFSPKASGFVSVYFGDDYLKAGSTWSQDYLSRWTEEEKNNLHWGNLVVHAGCNYRLAPAIRTEFTVAYTRFFSDMTLNDDYTFIGSANTMSMQYLKTANTVNDWIFRADFDWQPSGRSRVRFGADYVRHSFLPQRSERRYSYGDTYVNSRDSTWAYHANEANAYIEDDWCVSPQLRVNAGVHLSLFTIDGKVKHGIAPRLSASYRPTEQWAFKGAYSRTTQYVHQLQQSYMALPTDQWIPVTGNFKPQTADKVAVGAYWQSIDGIYAASVEGYYKWMRNLLDYRDEYYLKPPMEMWNARLTQGRGTAKGIDIKVEKVAGKLTGHISYSLAWADRTFAEKNDGKTFPARFDNRHTINIVLNWNINQKVQLNAAWTGHSGNRFTLLPQVWQTPPFGTVNYANGTAPLRAPLNNYTLPFYHRLDLSCTVRNRRGYWTFGLYNAYNHINTIAIRRVHDYVASSAAPGQSEMKPVFQKVKLLPIIPSISYTWQF